MPVRVQMLTGRGMSAGSSGSAIAALLLGLIVLLVLALVLLPVALIVGGVGLVAFGIYRVNRWLQGIGSSRGENGHSNAVESSDFDALKARLQERARPDVSTDNDAESGSSQMADQDGEGRRNVRVMGERR